MYPENFALVTRAATFTWEAQTVLLATDPQSAQVNVEFPRPVQIVSMYPSVSVHSGLDTLPVPDVDDLLVEIFQDLGQDKRLTSRFDGTQPNGVSSFPNVTLGSYRDTIAGARIVNIELSDAARPTLQVRFAWKRDVTGGPYYQNVLVGLTFNCNFLERTPR